MDLSLQAAPCAKRIALAMCAALTMASLADAPAFAGVPDETNAEHGTLVLQLEPPSTTRWVMRFRLPKTAASNERSCANASRNRVIVGVSCQRGNISIASAPFVWTVPSVRGVKIKKIRAVARKVVALRPRQGARLRLRSGSPVVKASFKRSPLFTGYVLHVARDPDFTEIVSETRVPHKKLPIEVPSAGLYYWRIGGITPHKGLGGFSKVRTLHVLPGPPYPLAPPRPKSTSSWQLPAGEVEFTWSEDPHVDTWVLEVRAGKRRRQRFKSQEARAKALLSRARCLFLARVGRRQERQKKPRQVPLGTSRSAFFQRQPTSCQVPTSDSRPTTTTQALRFRGLRSLAPKATTWRFEPQAPTPEAEALRSDAATLRLPYHPSAPYRWQVRALTTERRRRSVE